MIQPDYLAGRQPEFAFGWCNEADPEKLLEGAKLEEESET